MNNQEIKLLGMLSHVFGLSLVVPIFLYFVTPSDYVKRNVIKSLILSVILWGVILVYFIFAGVLTAITGGFFTYINFFIVAIAQLIYLAYLAFICYQLWQDREVDIPVVSQIEEIISSKLK